MSHARTFKAFGVGLAALALSVTGAAATPTSASPAGHPSAAGGTVTLEGLDGKSHTVTLITGDKVSLTTTGDGHYSVAVKTAAREDGTAAAVQVTRANDGVYAFPSDAQAYIGSGRLDAELFDVEYLAANGYADEVSAALPVIVEYSEQTESATVARKADALAATSRVRALESVDAAGVRVAKSDAADFWASLQQAGAVEHVWLDRKVSVALDQSVPQIGAPEAWAAGFDGSGSRVCVIDTGIDLNHPDMAGQVVASQSFVPGEGVADGHGHGTHVASTVAGLATASGGRYKGVAPGTDLVIAKGLSNAGSGADSQIIAAMEWCAADQDADVVSMSLGGASTDGTDPMSQAVNELTAETGALFVIAAGNTGPGASTVQAPGAADAALTVGAVDKSNLLASFSARGPRLANQALKPEITAPGVAIVAARSAGTAFPGSTPIDAFHTMASGTSMATPHVAGAAAILAQRHPDWDADELKPALVSTAKDGGYTVFEQGAGRVDVARAVRQQVRVAPATADFALIPVDEEQPPDPKTLTYSNPTAEAVTLNLTLTAKRGDGVPLPAGALTVAPASIEIPPGGTATAIVTLNPAGLERAPYSGRLVASTADGGTQLVTPVGFVVGERLHKVKVKLVPRADGRTIPAVHIFWLFRVGEPGQAPYAQFFSIPAEGTAEVYVPEGTYLAQTSDSWIDGSSRTQQALLVSPQVTVAGEETEIVLDTNSAAPIDIDLPQPAHTFNAAMEFTRTGAEGQFLWTLLAGSYGRQNYWTTPSEPVTKGSYHFSSEWAIGAPQITMSVAPDERTLHPIYPGYRPADAVRFSGRQTLPVVYAGIGTAQELAAADARGKLVILRPEWENLGICPVLDIQLVRAIEAGAAGVIAHPGETCDVPMAVGRLLGPIVPDIPMVAVPASEADALIDQLDHGLVTITVADTGATPYLYQLKLVEQGGVGSLRYAVSSRDLVEIEAGYHGAQAATTNQFWSARLPGETFTGATTHDFASPARRREYIGPVSPVLVHQRLTTTGAATERAIDVFDDGGSRRSESWATQPAVPGPPVSPLAAMQAQPGEWNRAWVCSGCRQGDTFYPHTYVARAETAHGGNAIGVQPASVHLFRGDEEIAQAPPFLGQFAAFQLPPERASYRLTMAHANTNTEWRFSSSRVTGSATPPGFACLETIHRSSATPCRAEPLIYLRYDAPVDLHNRVRVPGSHHLRVNAFHHPAGAPAIAGLNLWVSVDNGETWDRLKTHQHRDGEFTTTVPWPVLKDGTEVSLKAQAWDSAGNRVEQTVLAAYGLTAH